MAQKSMQAVIVLGGRVDNSFTQIGEQLLSLSMTMDEVSRKLIDFGKESIDVYRKYEDSLKEVEYAYSTFYGKGTNELKAAMQELDTWIANRAENTWFLISDYGNAATEAARAGLNLEETIISLETAEGLAAAGSMDLSQALTYMIRAGKATNTSFEELPDFVDEVAYSANRSMATVESMLEAIIKMGPTAQFEKNRKGLLSMIAVLHDMGIVGTQAGTMLRNSMIRILAPTEKAETVMSFLGVSEEDINAALEETEGDSKKAAEMLKELGFSAHDQEGNLKSFIGIFEELADAVDKMKDVDRDKVLSTIFPSRVLATGKTLIEGAKDEWKGLYKELENGRAIGYTEYGIETMMSGLTGAIKLFDSKIEETKKKTGKTLEEKIIYYLDKGGEIISKFNDLDDKTFETLVNGLTSIAEAGPLLSIAGWGIRWLGKALGSYTGKIALGATALYAFYKAASTVAEYDYKEKFGNLSLDSAVIAGYLEEVSKPFTEATTKLNEYTATMNAAVKAYTDKSSELAQGIISKMVMGTKLTKEEEDSFITMGETIIKSLNEGMKNGYAARVESITVTYGGQDEAKENPLFNETIMMLEAGYGYVTERANELSQQLRDAMTSAFSDGELTTEEVENIQSIFKEMNKVISINTNAALYAEQKRILEKSQNLSLDGVLEFQKETNEAMDKILKSAEENYFLDYGYEKAVGEALIGTKDRNGEEYTEKRAQAVLDDLDHNFDLYKAKIRADMQKGAIEALDYLLYSTELSDVATFVGDMAVAVRNGEADAEAVMEELQKTKYGKGMRTENKQYLRFLNDVITGWGGEEATAAMIRQYTEAGEKETAEKAQRMLDSWRLYNNDYSSFNRSSAYNENMETIRRSWTEEQKRASELIKVEEEKTKGLAEESKNILNEIINPVEVEMEYPDAGEEAKKWGAEFQEGLPKAYMSVEAKSINGTSASATTEKSSGGFLGGFLSWLGFADGGRSDEPAIFGEGPTAEWAIPEAHTPRTAGLLTAAAEASGFSWGELAGASGSDRSGGNYGDGITVHYSPTIYADNAENLRSILEKDKTKLIKELDRWWSEKKLYESVTSYT